MASATSKSTNNLAIIIGLVVVLAAALGFALLGGEDVPPSDFDPDELATPAIDGQALPADAAGTAAPQVTAPSLLDDGDQQLLADGEGTMIVFLAHWCPHCNREVPAINRWLEDPGLPDGTQLRAVATSIDETRGNYPPDTWLREREWTTPTLVDTDGSIAAAYGVDAFPYWVYVGADGTVQAAGSGEQSPEALTQAAEQLAAG